MPYVIEPMQLGDVPEVSQVERECFTNPWPASAYRRELRETATNRYVVVRWVHPSAQRRTPLVWPAAGSPLRAWLGGWLPHLFPPVEAPANPYPIAGFAGLWLMVDEAHVTTIGIAPAHRGRRIGELLFLKMVDLAVERRATWLTLEVRVSNTVAQNLYRKYGLTITGTRKRYYSDNGEDAYMMSSEPLQSPAFHARLARLRADLQTVIARQEAEETGTYPRPLSSGQPSTEKG